MICLFSNKRRVWRSRELMHGVDDSVCLFVFCVGGVGVLGVVGWQRCRQRYRQESCDDLLRVLEGLLLAVNTLQSQSMRDKVQKGAVQRMRYLRMDLGLQQ